MVTRTTGRAALSGAPTDPYPFKADGTLMTPLMSQQMLSTNGADGAVQSLNSVPAGFGTGTGSYAYTASVQRSFAAVAARQATGIKSG